MGDNTLAPNQDSERHSLLPAVSHPIHHYAPTPLGLLQYRPDQTVRNLGETIREGGREEYLVTLMDARPGFHAWGLVVECG